MLVIVPFSLAGIDAIPQAIAGEKRSIIYLAIAPSSLLIKNTMIHSLFFIVDL